MMVFQFVDTAVGGRTTSMQCPSLDEFPAMLEKIVAPEKRDTWMILVLINDANQEDWEFSTRSLITVNQFLSMHGAHDHERQILSAAERYGGASPLFPGTEGGDSTEPV